MRSFRVDIPLIGKSRQVVEWQVLNGSDDGSNVTLSFEDGPLAGKTFRGVDYFFEFGAARNALEQLELMPACQGALIDVFPGGMLGEASLGKVAHKFDDLGNPIGKIHIFDHADPQDFHKIVYFGEQKSFRKATVEQRRRSL